MGDKMKAIGIDLGGTTIKAGLVDFEGNIVKKIARDTANNPKEILEIISSMARDLSANEDILGIGLGSPGFIDSNQGKVLSYGGMLYNWEWTDIKGYLCKKFPNLIIEVENDANIAALCEKWVGSAINLDSFIMITLGTGLGGAIYTPKEGIWNGYRFQGGELGHAILYPKGRVCKCGQEGCVENYLSGSAIEKDYEKITENYLKGEEIFKLYHEDIKAKSIIDDFAVNLAIYLISLRNIFDPQGVIIGGGLINSADYWWDKMINEFSKRVNFQGMKILPARYLNDSGIIGAAKMIVDKR